MKPYLPIAGVLVIGLGLGYWWGSAGRGADIEGHQRERDSLTTVASNLREEITALTHYTDSLKAHTDSVVATFQTPEVIVENALKFTRYSPLQAVQDSLMTP